ncbi:cyclase family protein [Rhodopila sp.]|jgi:kynurenine formamidase|uniref:cyclase family protein n=1 Tax=Rhodopila sp. TaxID=2480087 RepID=UPI002CD888AA|nr:cyclase family protein [Rhodopila sp.]HVZ08924.1 cyclase family protein [Rhodopila sp.]
MSRDAWNRWGEQDERGALNHIGSAQVQSAAGLVRSGTVLTLAQPLSPRTPVPRHRAGIQHFMGRDGGDYAAGARKPGGFQFAEDTVVLPLHIGTHIDALCHAWYDEALYNGFPGSGTRSTGGATRCGIDKMGPIVGRGVLLDIVAQRGGPLPDGTVIGAADLERAAKAAGVTVGTGDIVLIRTGWAEDQARRDMVSFDTEPGLDLEAGLWLAEREIAVLGADNFAVEVVPFAPGTVFPVHQRLIRDFGIPLLEGLVLRDLAAAGQGAFLFAASPLPVVGGTGSPISPIAIL